MFKAVDPRRFQAAQRLKEIMSDTKTVTWRTSVGVANMAETSRGFVQRIPARQAKQYVAQGLCDYGKVPVDQLGPPYEIDEFRVKLQAELNAENAKAFVEQHPELQPKPGTEPIGSRYRRAAREGWGA
jgi:hypothetical protein